MRVAWVHPSWRDLVIEHLAADDIARDHYLHASSIHGVLLALSGAGGADGTRRLPLLTRDSDWDAVTDRVHALTPQLESAELIGLLDAIQATRQALCEQPAQREADALARTALARSGANWAADGGAIAVAELIGWLALARELSPLPAPPPLAATWAELLPVQPPQLSDFRGVERFTDWLALADAVRRFDREALAGLGLGVGTPPPHPVTAFLDAVADATLEQLTALPSAWRALHHIGRLFPALEVESATWRDARARSGAVDRSSANLQILTGADRPHGGARDVERVLRDL